MNDLATGRRERLRRILRRPAVWAVALTLLVGNWVISSHVGGGPDPVRVPYTIFRDQVQHGNVAEVTSQSDEIGGRFRAAARMPGSQPFMYFKTVRPAFAGDD